jgi:hypothetical protein
MPGQRTNTKLLTSAELTQIQRLLGLAPIQPQAPAPAAPQASGPAVPQTVREWRGTKDLAFRTELIGKLTEALEARLAKNFKLAQDRAAMRKIDLSMLEPAGEAAKATVTEVFSEWTTRAPLRQSVIDLRRNHRFTGSGPAANILDVADAEARAAGEIPVNGRDTAKWIAANDPGCREVMGRYDFNPYSATKDEETCLSSEVLDRFCESGQHRLDECDRLGYWMANPDLGLVFAPRYVAGWTASDDENVPVVWNRKAEAYLKLIHEYIHVLQHPGIPFATDPTGREPPRAPNAIKEGVCEYLTVKAMKRLADKPETEFDTIAAQVESSPRNIGRGGRLKGLVGGYQAADDYAADVENVRQAVALMGGDNGLLAAFFQGHTEYIGRYFFAKWLDGALEPAPGQRTMPMPTPGRFQTLADLAAVTGLDVAAIRRHNPHLTSGTELPGQIYLPGFHGHFMVMDRSSGQEQDAWEDWAMIAAQHDVGADRIRLLNGDPAPMPFVQWILVPDS